MKTSYIFLLMILGFVVSAIEPDPIPVTNILTPDITAPEVEVSVVDPVIVTPYVIEEDDGTEINIRKEFISKVIDKRNAFYDTDLLGPDSTVLEKWLAIYNAEYQPIEFVIMPSNVRMIAEVRLPQNEKQRAILDTNLFHYEAIGYNAVLVTFSGEEDPIALRDLVAYIKSHYKFKVWYAYGGEAKLTGSKVFIDPDKYKELLQIMAPVCDGFLSGWKRTSAHLFYQDDKFMQYTATTIRAVNSKIPIVGEIYWGATAFSDVKYTEYGMKKYRNKSRYLEQYDTLAVRAVNNASGYLLVGFGSVGINVESVMNSFLKDYPGNKMVVITGAFQQFPLLIGKVSYQAVQESIIKLRTRWFNAGAYGIIVPHAGMINETKYPYTDNMSVQPYTDFLK